MLLAIIIFGLLLLGGAVWLVSVYNRLVTLHNRWKNAFAQIDVQLKRRHDLIPNLVESVKGYMAHESDTLQKVIAARNDAASAISAPGVGERSGDALLALAAAEQVLGGAMGMLIGRMEAYPQLKADGLTLKLMEELSTTENRIAFARQAMNDSAMFFNTARQAFPTVAVAGLFGYQDVPMFELSDPTQREVVAVKL